MREESGSEEDCDEPDEWEDDDEVASEEDGSEEEVRVSNAQRGRVRLHWASQSSTGLWRSTTSAARAWARRVGVPAWPSPLDGACDAPRLNVALARLVDLKAALLAEARARGPDGSRMRSPQLARRSRDQLSRSVDGWASMALRSDVWSRRRV